MTWLARFFSRWQEPLVWVPVVLVVMLIAYRQIPEIDPRAGIDGWGSLWGMLLVLLAVLLAGFVAWLFRTTYHLELTDADERELIDHAAGIERASDGRRIGHACSSWQAVVILAMDRLLWLAVFWLALSRLAP